MAMAFCSTSSSSSSSSISICLSASSSSSSSATSSKTFAAFSVWKCSSLQPENPPALSFCPPLLYHPPRSSGIQFNASQRSYCCRFDSGYCSGRRVGVFAAYCSRFDSGCCSGRRVRVFAAEPQKKAPQISAPNSTVPPSISPSTLVQEEDLVEDETFESSSETLVENETVESSSETLVENETVESSSETLVETDSAVTALRQAQEQAALANQIREKLRSELAAAVYSQPRPLALTELFGEMIADVGGVIEEIRFIEWPPLQNVVKMTGVVLGIIFGSSIVVLTFNAILAEISDQIFNHSPS